MKVMMKMMSKLKEARLDIGMTQKEVTDLLEIPIRTWQKWETGDRIPAPWAEKLILEKLSTIE